MDKTRKGQGRFKLKRCELNLNTFWTLKAIMVLRRIFFEHRALRGQKDHNNLLPPVKFNWKHVCFAPGNTLVAAIIISIYKKCCSLCSFLTFVGKI